MIQPNRKNILFSTTRGWNCGDEFIYWGVSRLLKSCGLNFNSVFYNRHPTIRSNKSLVTSGKKQTLIDGPRLDDSFHLDATGCIDYMVVAGSPAWTDTSSSRGCLEYAHREQTRIAFLGVGNSANLAISPFLEQLLRCQTDLIVSRDQDAYDVLPLGIQKFHLPCPALFSVDESYVKQRNGVNSVALVIQDDKTTAQSIMGENSSRLLIEKYKSISKTHRVRIIAHYIDDFVLALQHFPSDQVYYSSDSNDYLEFFNETDFVISPRVHGCGIAASLGIPSISVSHDARGSTAKGFLSKIVTINEIASVCIPEDISSWSSAIISHRQTAFQEYKKLLLKYLSIGPEKNDALHGV